MKRSLLLFWSIVFFGATGIALLFWFLWNAYPFALVGFLSFAGFVHDFCSRIGNQNTILLYGLAIGFGVVVLFLTAILVRFAWALVRTHRETRVDDLVSMRGKLRTSIRMAGLHEKDVVVSSRHSTPFCAGFFPPRIIVPEIMVSRFRLAELVAVLLHEKQHILQRDPLRIFIVRFVRAFFFFVPLFAVLERQYLLLSELEADARASHDFAHTDSLMGAMRKMYTLPSALTHEFVSQMASVLDARIEYLYSPIRFPRVVYRLRDLVISFAAASLLIGALWGSFHLSQALSVGLVQYSDGLMTQVNWSQVSLFQSSSLYLAPAQSSTSAASCEENLMSYGARTKQ